MNGRGCEEAVAHFAQFVLTASVFFQCGVMVGESRKSIKDDVRLSPSVAALTSYQKMQRDLAGEDVAKISTETLNLWARDVAVNEIEQRLKAHNIWNHRDNDKIVCSILDLIPADVAEITTAEVK